MGTPQDLQVAGILAVSGGAYRRVRISGEATVNGDMDCEAFRCYGTCTVEGNVNASQLTIYGTVRVRGNVQSQRLLVLGESEIDGKLTARIARISGTVNVDGDVSADEVILRGLLRAHGDCEAETFFAKGAFCINGLLNSGTIDVRLYGDCQVKEIGGERVIVRRRYWQRLFPSWLDAKLVAETIEGDEIFLEQTQAKVVRGNAVTIGPGCVIERVEYKEQFRQNRGAHVNESQRV